MTGAPSSLNAASGAARRPPYSEEAEQGVLGSILLDAARVMDICIARQVISATFHVPAHRIVYDIMLALHERGRVIDVLTVGEALKARNRLEAVGGGAYLNRLIDSTPTAAHAEYYIDIVNQQFLRRSILACAHDAENAAYDSPESAEQVLSNVEQAFLDLTESRHGTMRPWSATVKDTMEHIERILNTGKGLTGLSTGFSNLDRILMGLRAGEMIVLAARPSMGKTSLAMNMAENVALGVGDPDKQPHSVGVFSLEMSSESLVMRMLCSHAEIRSRKLQQGYLSQSDHGRLIQAASVLQKAPIFLDDTGGLDVLELRARARRMKKQHAIDLIVIDYLQLLHSRETARQGRQLETADISNNLKSMAKELRIPVLVLSQLSRAPEQRDKTGKPKLSDLRDSGAIEQDADVVCMLRRPCKYPDDPMAEDEKLSVVDVAKQRNGPTGEAVLNFEEDYTRFRDRTHGVDAAIGAFAEEGSE